MKKLLVWFLLLSAFSAVAQNPSGHLRVSLLTCAPGEELYSTFGHTAIRIFDSTRQTDIVYNYGTFDFSDPDFYLKFTRGKLDYFLSVSPMSDFMYEFQVEHRDVTEQVLDLPDSSRTEILNALNANMASPARYYKYDFLYNNCTTRVRDILQQYAGLKAEKRIVPPHTTFRNMLHEYLDKGNESWSKLGIDLLLGSPIDKEVTNTTAMFLPDYLMKGVDSSDASNPNRLVQNRQVIHLGSNTGKPFQNKPLFLFSIIAVLMIFISARNNPVANLITQAMDSILLGITGLLGLLLLFMWFGTDHKACAANYNLLWALPTNLIAAFAIWKKPKWLKNYFSITGIILLLTLLLWLWLPQQLNTGLLPIILWLLIRSVNYVKK
ncbi:MAG: DUF4105 domain-containing protein [Bacteroidota bacterium]|nr:DUF4105 domain-containing protein [Bacteroidota bacterium]